MNISRPHRVIAAEMSVRSLGLPYQLAKLERKYRHCSKTNISAAARREKAQRPIIAAGFHVCGLVRNRAAILKSTTSALEKDSTSGDRSKSLPGCGSSNAP